MVVCSASAWSGGTGVVAEAEGRATVRDVARLAGVSVATVSRALNGRHEVREETRLRVQEAADRLSFRLAPRQRRLSKDRQLTVGLLTSDSVGRFSIPVMLGAEDALGASGRVAVLLCEARGDAIREQHYLHVLQERKVDGIVVVGQRTDARPPLVRTADIPVVYAYAPSSDPRDVSFIVDNVAGAVTAVEHLLSLGRRRIAHITGPGNWAASRDRVTGLRLALERAGARLVGNVVYSGDWTARWGRHGAAMLLSQHPDVDAIFCGSDQLATGVLDILRESGRRVPEDVAVIGFDNWEVVATDARTPLTTIDMNLEELGRAAAQHLFTAIHEPVAPGVREGTCRLVIRQSTVPA